MFEKSFRPLLLAGLLCQTAAVGYAASATDQNTWAPGGVPPGQTNVPDGLDDIWQGRFNAWVLDPNGDEDFDGCSNLVESIAATNPFQPNDCFKVGDMTVSAGAVLFTVKVEAGKKYRVLSADNPGAATWNPETLQTPVSGTTEYVPSGDMTNAIISVVKPGNSKKFYRLETSDVDSNGDGVSDWAARELGLNPTAVGGDSNGDGVTDLTEITQEMQAPDEVTVWVDNAFTSEDGGSPGVLRMRRTRSLLGATVSYTVGGTAVAEDYYETLTGQAQFAVGEKEVSIGITPKADTEVEGSESVTVTLHAAVAGLGASQAFSTPLQIGSTDHGSVIIANSTTAAGTGLLARIYDHASSTQAHAANFGEGANYAYTRNGSSPDYTGTVVVTPTGVTTERLAMLLGAVSVGSQVKLSFNGGNLNTGVYNHQIFTVSAKTAANFTCTVPPSSALPASSSSTCNFSIPPLHPPLVERVDPVVNYDWIYGTPNGVGVTAAATAGAMGNTPDNYSTAYETYLHPAAAGSYRFQLDADDKARVLLDLDNSGTFELPGEQIVEHGWDGAATVGTFKISSAYALTVPTNASQRLKMRVEHVETTGDARCRLQWSRDGGSFANIPQAEQFTHTQAITYAFTRGTPVTTGTATISLTGHGLTVGNTVTLAFSNGTLFTPNTIDTNGYNGSYTVATVPDANSFTVTINSTGSTLPSNQSAGATGFLENRTISTTTGVYNKIYNNTTFAQTPGRVGVDNAVTTGNNGIWGSGTPDASLVSPDTFSIRWSGQVQPQFTEEYTFIVHADDGCALRINGQQMDLKTLPATNNDGSTYHYDSGTGSLLVNYVNARVKPGSFVVGETVRIDPSSGNLTQPNGSTYTYDATTGVMTVTYSNLTTVTPGSYLAGQFVELDPTSGTATTLGNARYTILADPPPTSTTFSVNLGVNAFASESAGTATINITDNRDAVVTAVYPAGSASYSYTSGTGVTVVDYSASGLPPGSLITGMNVVLDPTSNALASAGAVDGSGNNVYKTITAHTSTTFTVSYATGISGTSTGAITVVAPELAGVPATQSMAFALAHYPGRHANGSNGNVSLEIVNKPLKDWSSMGNERYVRLPVIGGTRYDIDLEYYESSGYARCALYWMSPSQPKQLIPKERLYPESVPQAPPAHVAETSATALVGGTFAYVVASSNAGSVTVSGLPSGLSYANGVISGTPTTAGVHQVLVTLVNADGTSTSALDLQVKDAGGSVTREVWTGISGTAISSIPLTTAPATTASLASLQAPTDAADDFGARVRGYITAPVTGNYYFWLAASDSAEFWLSNDDETINSIQRATVSAGGGTPQNWATAAKSPWMALEQGRRYYFELLHKPGAGAEHLALGWSKPGEPTTAPSEVVPGYVLSGYTPPAPGSTPGTLYVATLLSQNGAVTKGVGTATLRLSEDETMAEVRVTYSGLSGTNDGPTNPQPVAADGSATPNGVIDPTDWHVHSDPYLTHQSYIIYDGAEPIAGDGPQFDSSGNFLYHRWNLTSQGTLSVTDIRELLKQGKAYINLHTAMYPGGEIRGNFTLANGSRTFSPPPAAPSWTDDSNTDAGAARFLTQASFGPGIADITALKALTPTSSSGVYPASRYETWIDNQFAIVASQTLPEVLRTRRADAQGGSQLDETLFFNSWWRNSISGADQLRQRIAFALSEIHVISGQGPLDNRGEAIAYFYDKLNQGAFGNFREILETTTLTPAMGRYLDMRNNDKPDLTVGRIPNENYAREIKQLFSIGLYRMWPDGTLMLTSEDSPIDTYTQREIVGFAHVFTGWTNGYDGAYRTSINAPDNWMRLMREVPARHFTGPKRMLNNEVLPGLPVLGGQPLDPYATHNSTHYNQPAYEQLPVQELELSHDQLFNHPNTGPFICRQLIQRLVTSHPSRDYLYRVVQKFNNRGDGVRGDMQAVIKAILLDYEARSADLVTKPAFGKQREPLMRVAAAGRAFRPDTYAGTYSQSGTRTITINTTDGATPPVAKAHNLATGNNVLLDFTADDANAAPWTGTYSITYVDADTFTVLATGWATGTYSIPANSTTCTVTMSNHWLQAGHQVFMDFTSGGADGVVGLDGTVCTLLAASAETGTNGTFTFTVPSSTSARSGNCMIPRFSPGSMTIASSGLAAPNPDRRVTMRTNEDHHLKVGDQVQLNVYATQATPQPVDVVATVETVVDLKTYTFLIASTTTGWSNSQGNNSVYQFPLVAQPLSRSGTIQSRSSTFQMNNTDGTLEQSPVNPDTVFNFFLPDYKFPGALASQGITTPEFQITAETTAIRQANFLYDGVFNPNPTNPNGYSSFTTGSNAVSMDYSNWLVDDATNLGLGNPVTPLTPAAEALPWTHNQNIAALVDKMSILLTSDQLSSAVKSRIRNFVSQPITSITPGAVPATSPCIVTTSGPHGYTTGQTVCISGVTDGTFSASLNSTSTARAITVIGDPNTSTSFSVTGLTCTVAPTSGGLANAHASQVIYNQGNASPSAAERRDRFRAILHLILTSPDFTIQR